MAVTLGELAVRFGLELRGDPGVRLELAGDGELRAELETLVRELGLEHAVTFRGYVGHDALLDEIRAGRDSQVLMVYANPMPYRPATPSIHSMSSRCVRTTGPSVPTVPPTTE